MTQSPLARLAGPSALLAGILIIAAQLGMYVSFAGSDRLETLSNPIFLPSMVTYFIGFCVLLIALVAIYETEAHRAGVFGLIGFIAAMLGTTFLAGNHWFDTFAGPWIADAAPQLLSGQIQHPVLTTAAFASYVVFAVGWVLFGIASLRAGVFPALISIAIVVGGVAGFLALSAPYGIPLGVAITMLGAWMIRSTSISARRRGQATSDANPSATRP